MIHVSHACNPAYHTTGSHYLNGDTTAFMQLMTSTVFRDFPDLKLIIPHGGGAVPYHCGRFPGLSQGMKLPDPREHLLQNLFFRTSRDHFPRPAFPPTVLPL